MLTQNSDKGFIKYMMRLALPIALQNLLMAAFQLIDSAMVSRLGNAAMAGVSMAGRWSFIMMITLFGINSGASILYSQYKGVNDQAGIRRVYGLAVTSSMALVMLCGLVMAIFPSELVRVFAGRGAGSDDIVREGAAFMRIIAFNTIVLGFNYATTFMLRSTEEVRVPLVTSLIAVTINTGLNLVLIYGNLGMPPMGVRGAAVSTLVSSAVQALLLIVILRKRRHYVFTHMRELFSFTKPLVAKFYNIASPVFVNELLWSLGTSAYMFVFGRVGGVNGVPAYSLYSSVDQLLFSFVIGIASACGVMIGKAVGAGDTERAWREAEKFLLLGTLFALAMGGLEILLRVPLINLIQPEDPATGELAKQLLLIGGFVLPMRMLSMLLIVAIFRSGGKPALGAAIDVGCIWLVGVPVVAIAGFMFHLPFLWLFACIYTEEIIKVCLGLYYFFKKQWMRKLTEDKPLEAELPAETG